MGKQIDLNCDMGESFGAYSIGSDEEIMQYISSANIACGSHAGDPTVMGRTVRLAKTYNIAVGAHPGFPDLAGFGRRMIQFTPDEIYRFVVYQIGALQGFCTIHDVTMQHVKPHGALYNLAARDRGVALAIAHAVNDVGAGLILYGLAGSDLIEAGREVGLRTASEVFADRTYQADGSLTPRSQDGALMESPEDAVAQVLRIVRDGEVQSVDGTIVTIEADTVCVHGDGVNAVGFARELREAFEKDGVLVRHKS